jgi:L-ribulose-5-phosphate 3-epimerase
MPLRYSRREFLRSAAVGVSCLPLAGPSLAASTSDARRLPVVVFSKIYQSLKLNFSESAAVTAEAKLDGVDAAVRERGEVLPERVGEDLPRYVEALKQRGLMMPFITSGITQVESPHSEQILRTAHKLGVENYRIGFVDKKSDVPVKQQLEQMKAHLKDLAALNKQLGICGMVQNHSPSGRTFLGGDLTELRELVSGLDPAEIGVAFDIGHALIVHGDDWRPHFEALKPHLKVAYIKDAKHQGFVPFGEGEVGKCGYFKVLKEIGYHAPLCMHIEFDWSQKGKNKTRNALLQALTQSRKVLSDWVNA